MYFGWKSAGRCISLEVEVIVLIVKARGLRRKNAAVFRLTENSFEAACRIIINDKLLLSSNQSRHGLTWHLSQANIWVRSLIN